MKTILMSVAVVVVLLSTVSFASAQLTASSLSTIREISISLHTTPTHPASLWG